LLKIVRKTLFKRVVAVGEGTTATRLWNGGNRSDSESNKDQWRFITKEQGKAQWMKDY
jgi:hypothetical protein